MIEFHLSHIATTAMRRSKHSLVALVVPVLSLFAGMQIIAFSTAAEIDPAVAKLLEASCIHCHDENTETSLNLDSLSNDLTDPDSMRKWVHVFDRVRDGTMPPESEVRPDAEIARAAMGALDNWLQEFSLSQQQRAGRVPARRLTKSEYRFTVQDPSAFSQPRIGIES